MTDPDEDPTMHPRIKARRAAVAEDRAERELVAAVLEAERATDQMTARARRAVALMREACLLAGTHIAEHADAFGRCGYCGDFVSEKNQDDATA